MKNHILEGFQNMPFDFNASSRYTLYIGTSDKDTLKPLMELAEAKEIVSAICLKHTDGF